jgi:hypothetical protein
VSHVCWHARIISVFESTFYIDAYFGFPVAIKVAGVMSMSQRNKTIMLGVIVMAIAGLGLALTTLQNAATLVASAVWGS